MIKLITHRLIFLIALALAVQSSSRAVDTTTNAPLASRMVWAHSMICYPLDLDVKSRWSQRTYRETYPLLQEFGLEKRTGAPWQYTDILQAKAAGIDAFAIDVFNTPDAAEPYLAAADKAGGFLIAMCLDLSTTPRSKKEGEACRIVERYIDIARRHPSAARVNGSFVIDTYGTEQLDPSAWRRVRSNLEQAGYKTYWVASVDTGFVLRKLKTFPAAEIATALEPFEAGYIFEFAGPWWSRLIETFAALHRPFMGGAKPGYYRYNGSEVDPDNTAHYRDEWERDIKSPLAWNTIVTWNDLGETTGVMPTGDWNDTRSDLTAWYASKYKNRPPPFQAPRLYVTTAQAIYPGMKRRAEALVLNPLKHAVQARIRLIDAHGRTIGGRSSAAVAADSAGAATIGIAPSASQTGSFVRASAELFDGKTKLSSVISAPILILDPKAQAGYGSVCYSVPASKSLPCKIGVNLIPGSGRAPNRIEPIIPSELKPRFIEILHNTALVTNAMDGKPVAIDLPPREPSGALIGRTEWGFYVVRVTDADLRVGYSDPIYIAPPKADYAIRESYLFDGRSTGTITDTTPFKNAAVVKDGQWKRPGYGSDEACLALNGTTSRVNLVPSVTPGGPMRIILVVRPHAYGGVLFADTGGLIVSLTQDGHVAYTRVVNPGEPWPSAQTSAQVPLDKWCELCCQWDGTQIRIYVNGKLDGVANCAPGFDSYIRALGCNPFGLRSDYFKGDVARFETSLIEFRPVRRDIDAR